VKVARLHRWDLDYREAVALQERLAKAVVEGPPLEHARVVAAADVSGGRKGDWIAAAVVVMDIETLEVLEVRRVARRATWPYVPGCLSFREAPAVLAAFRQVRTRPDVVLCDGQGRAHPRRFGLASHVGLALDVPTIGCAKSLLVGEQAGRLGAARGSHVPLVDGNEQIGAVLRTRTGVKPVYVSVGHRIDLASAQRAVLAAAVRYRLPEPSRLAHQAVTAFKREWMGRGHA
jgi:deoxyribonuclease V